jgi:hypothetical protein
MWIQNEGNVNSFEHGYTTNCNVYGSELTVGTKTDKSSPALKNNSQQIASNFSHSRVICDYNAYVMFAHLIYYSVVRCARARGFIPSIVVAWI